MNRKESILGSGSFDQEGQTENAQGSHTGTMETFGAILSYHRGLLKL